MERKMKEEKMLVGVRTKRTKRKKKKNMGVRFEIQRLDLYK